MKGILDTARVSLGPSGHLIVESLDPTLHATLRFMHEVTDERRRKTRMLVHDFVPPQEIKCGMAWTSYLYFTHHAG